MIKLLRNPEVRRTLILQCTIGVFAAVVAFAWDFYTGIFTALLSIVFIALHLISTWRRYNRLASFAMDIDRILHGENQLSLETYAEGELGILQSEIQKMIIRLREQQQRLMDDRILLSDSIADISHQIRTPLTSANLLLSLLNEPDLSESLRKKRMFELRGLLSRIDWLVTALLKISQLDAGVVQFRKEALPLSELIQGAVSPLLPPMDIRGQNLSIQAEGSFEGDIAWTREAIANIAKNCMEHTPAGGTIEIRAQENALFTEITISDTGCGIAANDLPHIFDRFYKGSNSGESSFGIGLALARMIITAQNGAIKAENRPVCGAQFTIRFYKSVI